MKQIVFLSLLLVPAVAAAQQPAPVHVAPYPGPQEATAATAAEPDVEPEEQDALLSHSDQFAPAQNGIAIGRPRFEPSTAGWFGDLGFYVLRPQWGGGNPAFATAVVDDDFTTYTQTDFEHDHNFAPLVSIGYAGRNGLGIRGRWWTLQSTADVSGAASGDPEFDVRFQAPSLLGTGATFSGTAGVGGPNTSDVEADFRNRLDLDVIDLEGIWESTIGRNSLLLSSGVRYAHIGQRFDAGFAQTSTFAPDVDGTLRGKHSFNGAGPTVSLQGYRMIGQTNLSLYGLSRGSLLFGESRQRALSTFNIEPPPDSTEEISESRSSSLTSRSVRPVAELEVGANWTRSLGAFDLFAESGLVGMLWFNAGNAANSDSILGGEPGTSATAGTDNANQNLGLVGLRFSTGVRF